MATVRRNTRPPCYPPSLNPPCQPGPLTHLPNQGYFAPNASRPNLVVLLDAHTTKLTLSGTCEPYVVSGVQFKVGDSSYEVKAKKEVILSAGAFGTPQLLELSGMFLIVFSPLSPLFPAPFS